ncbi:MAG TPA: response regulator [Gemmataceae bacterium]|nr:response regulator [Gemmataceae bacterium]
MSPHILIVEDDSATRDALALLLAASGYATDTAADGHQALTYLRSHPAPGVVLLDLLMPVEDGWQFLAERHKDAALAAIPVLVLSAAGLALRPAALALGADDFLAKPASPEDLLAAIANYC